MCANSVTPNKSAPVNSLGAIIHFRQTSSNSSFKMFCLSCSLVLSVQTNDLSAASSEHFCKLSNGSGCHHLSHFLFHCYDPQNHHTIHQCWKHYKWQPQHACMYARAHTHTRELQSTSISVPSQIQFSWKFSSSSAVLQS